MDLLRFATAGNVDDGKSTLIGRLLHDCRALLDDQLDALRRESLRRGHDELNLAFATDGLKAEREHAITIDVAYRYFATARRRFILADCPGHLEYLRNMVTGLAQANLAVVLVDARAGVVEQTRRHCFLASLFRTPHLVLCVNKMDLVGRGESAFLAVREAFEDFSTRVAIQDVSLIPISAKYGDNVVDRSAAMPWYAGAPLLRHLEDVHIASDANLVDCRLPVQLAGGPRTCAGRLAGGHLRVGDEVMLLPAGSTARIAALSVASRPVEEAQVPQSVSVTLDRDVVLARGHMLVRVLNQPPCRREVDAMVCWFGDRPLAPGSRWLLLHGSRRTACTVRAIDYRFDMHTLERSPRPAALALNDIGRVELDADEPLCLDSFERNRVTGSFVLVDQHSLNTVAACLAR
jgi:sulfate adenylyltransferase large subunit